MAVSWATVPSRHFLVIGTEQSTKLPADAQHHTRCGVDTYIEMEQDPKTSAKDNFSRGIADGHTDHGFRARWQPRGVEGEGTVGRARTAPPHTRRPRQRSCLRARQSLPSYGLSAGSR